MNTEKIKEYKEIYLGTRVPDSVVEESWKTLSGRLPYQDNFYVPFHRPLRFAVLSASILLLLVVTGLGFAQISTPNSILYPLKNVSNKIYQNLDGVNGKKIPTPKISQPTMDIIAPNSTITPIVSPTLSPTPVKKQENKENDNEGRKPNPTTIQQDVKGASTTNQGSNESKDGSDNKDNNGNSSQNHSQSNENHGNGNSNKNHDD